MSRVTSKLQVTVPKAIAQRYEIRPGDEIRFEESGEVIRVVPDNARAKSEGLDIETRLRLFDAATARQRDSVHANPDGRRAVRRREDGPGSSSTSMAARVLMTQKPLEILKISIPR